jgi:alkanesulfonate monooxygenase SsuD/methylene tetrahydromethanopterin reductase-like flavin-dependent oxidoreductase (luciferase family)
MQYGFVIPCWDIEAVPDLAVEAEAAGWDGVFIPDCIYIDSASDPQTPGYDPWVMLTAIAMRTERVRLGTMVTPVSRRRPWKLARETVTFDHLSRGRLILPVGLGALDDVGFAGVGEETDRRVRAELLDEGLAILAGLWSGQPFSFQGKYYHVENLIFSPPPVQSPRIPIWVVGAWPRRKSMQRALRWDGVIPNKLQADGTFAAITPADIQAIAAFVAEQRPEPSPFDIVIEGTTPGDDRERAAAQLRPYAEAGVTWWMETMWSAPNGPEHVRARIRQGPPRIM